MWAMVLKRIGQPLERLEVPDREPGPGEIRVKVTACGVCRTDLHVVDGELPHPRRRSFPVTRSSAGSMRRGAASRAYNLEGRRGSGTLAGSAPSAGATKRISATSRCSPATPATAGSRPWSSPTPATPFRWGRRGATSPLRPLLCAGLIGWRSLVMAGPGKALGLYGFGAAAHIIAQVALAQGRSVCAFIRPGDMEAQAFARRIGAAWAGNSDESPPEPLDAAIGYAPVGSLAPLALAAVRKGGRVTGLHMSDIPSFPYDLLWEERQVMSAANLTRQDGLDFLSAIRTMKIVTDDDLSPSGGQPGLGRFARGAVFGRRGSCALICAGQNS